MPTSRCLFGHGALLATVALLSLLPSAASAQRLPTGQRLRPPGRQVPAGGTMALGAVAVPGRPQVVVTCGGARQGLAVVDTSRARRLSFLPYQTLSADQTYTPTGSVFYGLALSGDGKTLFAARGSQDRIGLYALSADGTLAETATLDEANGDPKKSRFPAGVALSGDGTRLYAADNLSDDLAVFDVPSRRLLGTVPVGGYPLAVAALADGTKVYVSSERDSLVSAVDPAGLRKLRDIPTGSHPDALRLTPDGARLFVANAQSDTVSIVDTRTDAVLRTVLLRPAQARGLPGVTPTGLALSPDARTLYVTLADMNAVAVLALNPAHDDAALRGYIPAGWYPTAVTVTAYGRMLCVVNAKGSRARFANPQGPDPYHKGDGSARYVHNLLEGSVSLIPAPSKATLAHDTRQVLADNSVGRLLDPDDGTTARRLGRLPVKHVIYIIKENRTYDQVLGDMAAGNGDPSLTLFGRDVTPNQHALASQFVLLDNFYDCAEVSPDGWNWSTAGFANEYVQRTVPENYSEKRGSPRPAVRSYDYEGESRGVTVSLHKIPDVSESPGGYIWDAVARKGLTLRDYGAFLSFTGAQPTKPVLVGHTCPDFAPFTMKFADSDAWVTLGLPSPGQDAYGAGRAASRFSAWKREFDGYVARGDLPAFELLRLPRDHTQGTAPGYDSPRAMAADNDYAVGEVVQAVSHSRYWKDTAIFVVEDDAQNGPDHVDCHRSTAYIVSPWIRRGTVDHHFYNTDSLLRTMELLLGLSPMTRLDAVAPPIRAFGATPDLTPYTVLLPDKAILAEKNDRNTPGAARSAMLDFSQADAAPDDVLNDILWHSVKGASAPPPPVRRGLLAAP